MLDLSSSRWALLRSSSGGDGRLTADLLSRIARGEPAEAHYEELHEQLCHQLSLSEVAYAAAPHLARNAEAAQRALRWPPLQILGEIAALRSLRSESIGPPPGVPDDLRTDLEAALTLGMRLTAEELAGRLTSEESRPLIAALAGFQGEADLAIHLFLSGRDLSCPSCGEPIKF